MVIVFWINGKKAVSAQCMWYSAQTDFDTNAVHLECGFGFHDTMSAASKSAQPPSQEETMV